ncbi:MAG TPA: CxxxxCH/CxxCH domain-containing protein [Kofleriaceae bacterium]|nr:CxxxxCH/CxxCH domain-containing protein [Kofleriaceae bacterium]
MRAALVMVVALASCADERTVSAPCAGDCTPRIHPTSYADPASPTFHGRDLPRRNWDFALCASCHGADFSGGRAGVSCLTCHRDGPTACTTCHGTGPTSHAHPVHASRGVACAACHTVPTRWDDDGHIVHDGVAITAPAKVTFGPLAQVTPFAPDRAGPPSWDGATCRNVYCHGDVLHAAGGTATQPRWDDATPPGGCDRCHAAPPPSHARADCATCHPASAPHIDGALQVGRAPGCAGCHGTPASIAPPVDLAGNTATTAIGVGAHQAHLQARSRISAPIACATCHAVPADITSPGHLDAGPAKVAAELGWDRASQTCTTAWCHGPGRPAWTSSGQVACGTCHGVPPTSAPHTPAMRLTDCATCHPGTVDAFGNILVTGQSSEHINGVVDHL